MNFKRAGILAIVLVVTLVGATLFFNSEKKISFPLPGTEEPVVDTDATPKSFTEIKKETFSEDARHYVLEVEYPVTDNASVNAYIREFTDSVIENYKKDVTWAESVENPKDEHLSLTVTYESIATEKIKNYRFTIGTYTGGAHGLQATKVMRFTPDGRPVAVEGLFTDTKSALQAIAPVVKRELAKGDFANADWIAEGAAPDIANYQNIIVTNKGITVVFDPYSVAAYAAGMQEIAVPLSAFEKTAKVDFFTK